MKLERLGSRYGGWTIPSDMFDARSVCYSVGIGEDVSFDLALIEKYGCKVFAFDPTPRAEAFVAKNVQNPNFHHYSWGIWDRDAMVKFFGPRDRRHVSHSIQNLQRTSDYFWARVRTLDWVMQRLGHPKIDLLKLDIEGAEYDVLELIARGETNADWICVEFHCGIVENQLEGKGYVMLHRQGKEALLRRQNRDET